MNVWQYTVIFSFIAFTTGACSVPSFMSDNASNTSDKPDVSADTNKTAPTQHHNIGAQHTISLTTLTLEGDAKILATLSSAGSGTDTADSLSFAIPSNAIPSNALPAQAIPANALPAQALPAQAIPANAIPSNALPASLFPASEALPAQFFFSQSGEDIPIPRILPQDPVVAAIIKLTQKGKEALAALCSITSTIADSTTSGVSGNCGIKGDLGDYQAEYTLIAGTLEAIARSRIGNAPILLLSRNIYLAPAVNTPPRLDISTDYSLAAGQSISIPLHGYDEEGHVVIAELGASYPAFVRKSGTSLIVEPPAGQARSRIYIPITLSDLGSPPARAEPLSLSIEITAPEPSTDQGTGGPIVSLPDGSGQSSLGISLVKAFPRIEFPAQQGVSTLAVNSDGKVFVGGDGGTVFRVPATGSTLSAEIATEQDNTINDIAFVGSTMWLATDKGPMSYEENGTALSQIDANLPSGTDPDSKAVITATYGGKTEVWFGMRFGGLLRAWASDGTPPERFASVGLQTLNTNTVRAIAYSNNELWLGTDIFQNASDAGALTEFSLGDLSPKRVYSGAGLPTTGDCTALLPSATSGEWWIGTNQGLYLSNSGVTTFILADLLEGGLTPYSIAALLRDSAGVLWVATREHGVFYTKDETTWKTASPINEHFNLTGENSDWSLAAGSEGGLWVGNKNGVALFDTSKLP